MNNVMLDEPVGQIVAEHPSWARVFEEYRIDYCCGGKLSLRRACESKGIDPNDILSALGAAAAARSGIEPDWSRATLAALTAEIVSNHHRYLWEEMPRLENLIHKVEQAHGHAHPELLELSSVFSGFKSDMEAHMLKEESVLFPHCRLLENSEALPHFQCVTVHNPIAVMEAEHASAASDLVTMNRLTNGFEAPANACSTYRVMLNGLARLEDDTRHHVHKENNILFPRAAALEDNLRQNTR